MIKSLRLSRLIVLFLALCSFQLQSHPSTFSKTAIVTEEQNGYNQEIVDEGIFPAGMFMFFVLTVALILFSFGAGIVFSLCILLIILALLALGVFSTSLAVGLYNKSLSSGFKTMLVLSCTVGGTVVGTVGAYILYLLLHSGTLLVYLFAGLFSGTSAGIGFGYLVWSAFKKIGEYFMKNEFTNG